MDPYEALQQGMVIPASPLALTAARKLDAQRQRTLWRYYAAAGAGGIAIGVHTTQFAIREVGMYAPLLKLAKEEFDQLDQNRATPLVRIAGLCGQTQQAVNEATLAREQGFHVGLLSLAALKDASFDDLLEHCRQIAAVLCCIQSFLVHQGIIIRRGN